MFIYISIGVNIGFKFSIGVVYLASGFSLQVEVAKTQARLACVYLAQAVTQPEASTDPVRAAETSTYAMNMGRSLLSLNFLQILVLVVTCVGE